MCGCVGASYGTAHSRRSQSHDHDDNQQCSEFLPNPRVKYALNHSGGSAVHHSVWERGRNVVN